MEPEENPIATYYILACSNAAFAIAAPALVYSSLPGKLTNLRDLGPIYQLNQSATAQVGYMQHAKGLPSAKNTYSYVS